MPERKWTHLWSTWSASERQQVAEEMTSRLLLAREVVASLREAKRGPWRPEDLEEASRAAFTACLAGLPFVIEGVRERELLKPASPSKPSSKQD